MGLSPESRLALKNRDVKRRSWKQANIERPVFQFLARSAMQLERNLNPTLSAVYICTGVLMILAGIVTYARLPNWAVAALMIFGALSIIGGKLHH
jgi:hypothetical protein